MKLAKIISPGENFHRYGSYSLPCSAQTQSYHSQQALLSLIVKISGLKAPKWSNNVQDEMIVAEVCRYLAYEYQQKRKKK